MSADPFSLLPLELVREITKQFPHCQRKELRLVNKSLNGSLRGDILSAIILSVDPNKLDLSLFEELARDRYHPGSAPSATGSGICALVKRLVVHCLDPSYNFNFKQPPRVSDIEMAVCVKRLTTLLPQALYGLRYVEEIYYRDINNPSTLSSTITRWISTQVQNVRVLAVPQLWSMRPPVFENLNEPSLSTLQQLFFSIPYPIPPRLHRRLQNVVMRSRALSTLHISGSSLEEMARLLQCTDSGRTTQDPHRNSDAFKFPHITHLILTNVESGTLESHLLKSLTPTLVHLSFKVYSMIGSRYRSLLPIIGKMWSEMKPDLLVHLEKLNTNTLSEPLFQRLVDSFPKLRNLTLSVPQSYTMSDAEKLWGLFFNEVAPALASRQMGLEGLAVNGGDRLRWSLWWLAQETVRNFEELVRGLECLQRFEVTVSGHGRMAEEAPAYVISLVQTTRRHPSLGSLVLHLQEGFALPNRWECPWDASNGPLTLDEAEKYPLVTVMGKECNLQYEPRICEGSVWYM